MKAHPRSAMFHVALKRSALSGIFGTSIEKDHDLIGREKARIQILPIGCGVEAEIVLRRHLRKPPLGFMNEADVRLVLLGGKERDHSESRFGGVGAEGG